MAKHAEDCTLTIGGNTVGYAQSADVAEVGNEVEVTGIGDVWKEFEVADLEATIDIDQLWIPTEAAFSSLRTAFLAKGIVAFSLTDNAGYGRSGNARVVGMGMAVNVGGAVTCPTRLRVTGAITDEAPAS